MCMMMNTIVPLERDEELTKRLELQLSDAELPGGLVVSAEVGVGLGPGGDTCFGVTVVTKQFDQKGYYDYLEEVASRDGHWNYYNARGEHLFQRRATRHTYEDARTDAERQVEAIVRDVCQCLRYLGYTPKGEGR